jgi:hypothetical protein
LHLLEYYTGKAWSNKQAKGISEKEWAKKGKQLLEKEPDLVNKLEILAEGFENSRRKAILVKTPEAYKLFRELITYYCTVELIGFIERKKIKNIASLLKAIPAKTERNQWKNAGGQLIPNATLNNLIKSVKSGKTASWDEVHEFYRSQGEKYPAEKFRHAYASLLEILNLTPSRFTKNTLRQLLKQALTTRDWMTTGIYQSRAKDYSNSFRKMVYETEQELEKVIGKLKDNSFILQQQEELATFTNQVEELLQKFA